MSLTVTLEGVPEAIAALDKFSLGIQRKQTRIALSAAGGVIKQEVIKRVPVRFGILKKYQIVKTALSKDKNIAYTIVGAKRRVKVAVSEKKNGELGVIATFQRKKDGALKVSGEKRLVKAETSGKSVAYQVPSRYSHLAERKTKYLAKSLASAQYRAAEAAIRKLKQGVEEETRKAASKIR
jgi:hypothetical protein